MAKEKWRLIGTVPTHQSVILCFRWKPHGEPFVAEGYLDWDGETWRYQDGSPLRDEHLPPTNWQPLPKPPVAKSEDNREDDLAARLWYASGELAAHGGFDNHCRALDEAATELSALRARVAELEARATPQAGASEAEPVATCAPDCYCALAGIAPAPECGPIDDWNRRASALPAAPMPGVKAAATEGWLACHRQIREMFEGYSVEHMVAALEPSDSYELQQVFTELEAGAPPAAAPGVEALLDFEPQIAFSHFGPERSLRWILEWFYKSNGIEEAKAKAVTESYVAALSELLATRTAASKAEPQP